MCKNPFPQESSSCSTIFPQPSSVQLVGRNPFCEPAGTRRISLLPGTSSALLAADRSALITPPMFVSSPWPAKGPISLYTVVITIWRERLRGVCETWGWRNSDLSGSLVGTLLLPDALSWSYLQSRENSERKRQGCPGTGQCFHPATVPSTP